MPDPADLSKEAVAKQARVHLESLRAAGVTWLPFAPVSTLISQPIPPTLPAAPPEPSKEVGEVAARKTASLEQRRTELQLLAQKVSTCTRCAELATTRTQTVFGVGPLGPDLCFIGEAPGADEDAQGEPFVGAAGQLLNKIIAACGLTREEVYICNTIKCRPPGNRTPLVNEVENCREYLERQLELIQPKFICALGTSAAQSLLQVKTALGKLRGQFHYYKSIPVMCTYHPAYLLPHRNPEKKKDVWQDMKWLMEKMGRPVKS